MGRSELQQIVSKIAEPEEGLLFLGIVGALTGYYDDKSVASVFDELAKWKGIPKDLAPTMEGWETVVSLLGGQLASTEFNSTVDKYTQLGQESMTEGLRHTDKETVVAALNGMADQYHGEQKSGLTVYVGRDASWIAAAAEWLFDLKIEFRSKDNRVLYSNSKEDLVQFSIRFQPPGVPVDGVPIESIPLVLKERGGERQK